MKKRSIRCYLGYGKTEKISNIEVYFVAPDFYASALYTCLSCGEIFYADLENPKFRGQEIKLTIKEKKCPTCNSDLKKSLVEYPKTFRTADGELGSFDSGKLIPPDSESLIRDFYEL